MVNLPKWKGTLKLGCSLWIILGLTYTFALASLTASPHFSSLEHWLEKKLKSKDPWARFATRARILSWSHELTETQQAYLLSLQQEKGTFKDLKLWLQALHALKTSHPDLTLFTQALGFLKAPLISAQMLDPQQALQSLDWDQLPPALQNHRLYPVEPWGKTGMYGLWALQSSSRLPFTICVSHMANLHLWLNGQEIGSVEGSNQLWLDQHCWRVSFQQGVNHLLVHATGQGLWGVRILDQNRRPITLKAHRPNWNTALSSSNHHLPVQLAPYWDQIVHLVDQATELGSRGRSILSDEGLLGIAYYATLADIPESQRLSPVIEAHLRWEKQATLTLIEALEALTPLALRTQSWADYPPPQQKWTGIEAKRALRLWLNSARDYIREGHFAEARHAINHVRLQYPEDPSWAFEEAQMLSELGLSYSAFQVCQTAYQDPQHTLSYAAKSILGRELIRMLWQWGKRKEAFTQLQSLLTHTPATTVDRRALRTWLELSMELGDVALKEIGGEEALKLRTKASKLLMHGSFAWSSLQLAAEIALQAGRATDALDILNTPHLQKFPTALTLKAQALSMLGEQSVAQQVLDEALNLAPHLDHALSLQAEWSNSSTANPHTSSKSPFPSLGPSIQTLFEHSPWGPLRGDADPPPVRILYDHTHLDLDSEGRLIRQHRVVIEVLKPLAAIPWQMVRIPHHPALEELTLGTLTHLQAGKNRPPKITHEGLSDVDARLYYDAVVDVIDFGALQEGDRLAWEWRSVERHPDRQGIRMHGALIPLQGYAPIALKLLTLGPNAQKKFHIALESRKLWIQQRAGVLELRGIPALRQELNRLRGASALSYAHVSVLSSWDSVRTLYREILTPLLTPKPKITALAQQWSKGQHTSSDIIRALYLEVTRRVRYVGLEFGQHSFTPADPLETLSRGFGDCKDRAILMIALAQALGIELQFAMVRTASAGRVEIEGAASLGVFNHAALYSPDLKRFLDPTLAHYDPWVLPADDQGAQALLVPISSNLPTHDVPAQLTLIPYQTTDHHLERFTQFEHASESSFEWELYGIEAARVRNLLEKDHHQIQHDQTYEKSWFHTHLKQRIGLGEFRIQSLSGLDPVIDPLKVKGILSTSSESTKLELESLISSWELLSRLAPTATRNTVWRQLPESYEICLPSVSKIPQLHFPNTSQDPLINIKISTRDQLSCVHLDIQGGELTPQAYLKRRAQLIDSEQMIRLWLKAHLRISP